MPGFKELKLELIFAATFMFCFFGSEPAFAAPKTRVAQVESSGSDFEYKSSERRRGTSIKTEIKIHVPSGKEMSFQSAGGASHGVSFSTRKTTPQREDFLEDHPNRVYPVVSVSASGELISILGTAVKVEGAYLTALHVVSNLALENSVAIYFDEKQIIKVQNIFHFNAALVPSVWDLAVLDLSSEPVGLPIGEKIINSETSSQSYVSLSYPALFGSINEPSFMTGEIHNSKADATGLMSLSIEGQWNGSSGGAVYSPESKQLIGLQVCLHRESHQVLAIPLADVEAQITELLLNGIKSQSSPQGIEVDTPIGCEPIGDRGGGGK